MGDCITCIKRLLLISGASISIVGVFIMAVAVWIFLENDPIRHILMANSIVSVSINCLLIFGIILFLVGVVGCFGAIREKQFFLSLFFMAIIFLFILQLLAGVLAFLNRDKLYKTTFVDQMNRTLTSKPPDLFGSENWVNVMREFECCGVIGLSDSTDIEFIRTCCAVATLEDREHCLAYKNNKDSPVSNSPVPVLKKVMGCYDAVILFYESYPYFVGLLSFVILTIEVSALFLAVMLYRELQ